MLMWDIVWAEIETMVILSMESCEFGIESVTSGMLGKCSITQPYLSHKCGVCIVDTSPHKSQVVYIYHTLPTYIHYHNHFPSL